MPDLALTWLSIDLVCRINIDMIEHLANELEGDTGLERERSRRMAQ